MFANNDREGSRKNACDSFSSPVPITPTASLSGSITRARNCRPNPTQAQTGQTHSDRSKSKVSQASKLVSEAEIDDILYDFSSDFSESESDVDNEEDPVTDSLTKQELGPSFAKSTSRRQVREDEAPDAFIELTELLESNFGTYSLYSLPPHRRCACHTLNLIAKEDIVKGSGATLLNIKNAVEGKVKKITQIQRRSAKASHRISGELGSLFIQPNATRWNSWFDTLKRIAWFLTKKRNELRDLFSHFKIPFFRSPEEEYVKEFVKVMRPLVEALDVIRLFMKYNAALPLSASCERLFSVAGRIFSPVRSRVSDKNFERLLFLKVNSKVLS